MAERTLAHPMVDACAFHEWRTDADLIERMSDDWRQLFHDTRPVSQPQLGAPNLKVPPLYANPQGPRDPNVTADRGKPGSDPKMLRKQLLEGGRRSRVVVTYDEGLLVTAYPDPYVAHAAVRAANEITAADWLDPAGGVYGLILVSGGLPEEAAAEVRRLGREPGFVGVALGTNNLAVGFGHPAYRPVLRAAAEMGLPVVLQANSDLPAALLTPPVAGGLPATFAEYKSLAVGAPSTHIGGMVIGGAFSELSDLKALVVGGGVSWLPGWIWRHDYYHKLEAHEAPWLQAPPSELFRERVRVTTYPIERADPDRVRRLLRTIPWLREILVYASGYPSYDWNQPEVVFDRIPEEWWPAVFRDNAEAFFRWPGRSATAAGPASERHTGGS